MIAHVQPSAGTLKRRCAIYTRKSHEEGLDQEFNSLDAQRESGETYIASQKHEGWVAQPTRYDDGGWSGSNTDRPAMKQLLADIEAGKIDVVVVYKIDRLSRSLIDFVGLLQLFERKNIAFVSVTQQFNTANPMGRLVLNILICFAQFERENIAERIRDKMGASRRRGKWVGGVPPLGYDVDYAAKKLVVNEDEAKTVRRIFERFCQVGSPAVIADELRAKGITTKSWTSKTGRHHAGEPFSRAHIYKVLHQQMYLGEVAYKGGTFPGEHPAILDRALWKRAHALLAENHTARSNRQRSAVPGFLKGVVRCGHCGSSMTMTYARKPDGRMYRYYRCVQMTKGTGDVCPLSQIAAGELEAEVLKHLRRVFQSPAILAATSQCVRQVAVDNGLRLDHTAVLDAMRSLHDVWDELFPGEQERIVEQLVNHLVVGIEHSELHLRLDGLGDLTSELRGRAGFELKPDGSMAVVRLHISARRRCGRTRLITTKTNETQNKPAPEPDALIVAIARAFRYQEQIESGQFPSIQALAEHEGVDEAHVRRQLRLTLCPPNVTLELMKGTADASSIKSAIRDTENEKWYA